MFFGVGCFVRGMYVLDHMNSDVGKYVPSLVACDSLLEGTPFTFTTELLFVSTSRNSPLRKSPSFSKPLSTNSMFLKIGNSIDTNFTSV